MAFPEATLNVLLIPALEPGALKQTQQGHSWAEAATHPFAQSLQSDSGAGCCSRSWGYGRKGEKPHHSLQVAYVPQEV